MADVFSKKKRSAVMALIRGKNTQPEKEMKRILRRAGISYRSHLTGLPGTPDIVLQEKKAVIFIDGCFWHGHHCRRAKLPASNISYWKNKIAANRDRDSKQRRALRRTGWKVYGFWTCGNPLEFLMGLPIPGLSRRIRITS